jgi:trans-2,3-dihydro-3-hydroxyanthranilate isomerase
MQLIAREINFAESTFITKLDGQSAQLRLYSEHEMQFADHRNFMGFDE